MNRDKVIEIAEEVSNMHPYKERGNRDSYSQYNEGWADACDVLGGRIADTLLKLDRCNKVIDIVKEAWTPDSQQSHPPEISEEKLDNMAADHAESIHGQCTTVNEEEFNDSMNSFLIGAKAIHALIYKTEIKPVTLPNDAQKSPKIPIIRRELLKRLEKAMDKNEARETIEMLESYIDNYIDKWEQD